MVTTDSNNNKIIHNENLNEILINSKIIFNSKNSICYIGKGTTIFNSLINFIGQENIAYISTTRLNNLKLTICNESNVYLGSNIYLNSNGSHRFIASERKNIIIGNNCLFSVGSKLRTSDAHIIYDAKTGIRINPAKSIYIGDHVWVGADCYFTKGAKVASGCVIGAKSVVSRFISANKVAVGVPAKIIKDDIFWTIDNTDNFTEEQTENYNSCSHFSQKRFIYDSSQAIDLKILEQALKKAKTANDKLSIMQNLAQNTNPNRFAFKCGGGNTN